jgi:hypothetical protein
MGLASLQLPGPGMPCENPDCPFWQHGPGESPAAMKLDTVLARLPEEGK